MTSRKDGHHVRIFIVGPLLSIVTGSLVGSAVVVVAGALTRPVSVFEMLQGFLFAAAFSLIVTLPFGTVAGLAGACAIVALGRGPFRNAGLAHWLAAGAAAGAALGFGVTALVLFSFAERNDIRWTFIPAGALAGLVAGATLGALGSWEFGSPRASRGSA